MPPTFLESMKFGLKTYMKEGAYGTLAKIKKSKSNFGKTDDIAAEVGFIFISLIMVIAGFMLGWVAVSHICKGTDERSKNIRLGLYAIMLFTGGTSGFLYCLLWLFKVNVCA